MRIVLINQYYPPDMAPTGIMLEGVVERLVRDGHEVSVVCANGRYAGHGGGDRPARCDYRVVRIGGPKFGLGAAWRKFLDYLVFYCAVGVELLVMRPRPERIVALTTPPYLSVLARLASKLRGADHGHWLMDLYPEVMVAHGILREGRPAHRLLGWLAGWGMGGRRCAAVVTLGPDMAELAAGRVGADGSRGVEWVPLWGRNPDCGGLGGERTASAAALRHARGWPEDELVVMYSGNMGLGHRFGEAMRAALALAGEPVRWVFFGGGRRSGEIEAFMRENPRCRMELNTYVEEEQLVDHLGSADLHLVSLEAGWTGTMLPSKLQGVFAVGRPVVFIGGETSAMWRWVTESGGGWVVRPDDAAGLLAVLAEAREPAERVRRGAAAREFARRHFDRDTNVERVAELLGSAPSQGRGGNAGGPEL
jgi:glycosyltransferase involved in cell wall biosynthesis